MSQQDSLSHLVHTKLNQPRISAQTLARTRLYAVLNQHRPLTLVVAPAGYGKTTLLSNWAAQCPLRSSWLSLDAGDNQIGTFVNYLLAAVERLYPDVFRRLAVGSTHSTATSYRAVARRLADELDEIKESFVLVLDDYQFIDDPNIHRFLAEVLRFPPRGLNLVIASRSDPPLPLATMRAQTELSELRAGDLRFTPAEMTDYLARELQRDVDAKTLAIIEASTEGWIAGLHLAALFLRDRVNPTDVIAQFSGPNHYSIEYLANEVLAHQAPEVQEFLIKTSILQRMCPALCDAVLGAETAGGQSSTILAYLSGHDLFVVPLDDHEHWYRYHHLFQQLLNNRMRATLSGEKVRDLYAAASAWCAGQNLREEAIAYAVAAGDAAGAVALIESARHQAMNAENWQQLEQWLNVLPRPYVDTNPQMVLLEAWLLHKRQRLAEVPARLDLAEAMLVEGNLPAAVCEHLRGEICALRSQQYFNQGDTQLAYEAAQRALAITPAEYASVRGIAWIFLGGSVLMMHGLDRALAALKAAPHSSLASSSEYARLLIVKCYLYWMSADLYGLSQAATELQRYATLHPLPESMLWARYFQGCAAYLQYNLAAAFAHFSAVVEQQHRAAGLVVMQGSYGLALVAFAMDRADVVDAAIATVREYAQQTDNRAAYREVQLFETYLAARAGGHNVANPLRVDGRRFRAVPVVTLFAPPLATAALLLRQEVPAALDAAATLLQEMTQYFNATHMTLHYVTGRVLQARLLALRGMRPDALAVLAEALDLAQGGDLRLPFIENGAVLYELLGELKLTGANQAFAEHLRALIAAGDGAAGSGRAAVPTAAAKPVAPPLRHPQPRHPELLELLTMREMEVLQLLALRMTNKEIAQRLCITTGTVKQHTINVYRKLHVENRREAIVQAQVMGFHILTPFPL